MDLRDDEWMAAVYRTGVLFGIRLAEAQPVSMRKPLRQSCWSPQALVTALFLPILGHHTMHTGSTELKKLSAFFHTSQAAGPRSEAVGCRSAKFQRP